MNDLKIALDYYAYTCLFDRLGIETSNEDELFGEGDEFLEIEKKLKEILNQYSLDDIKSIIFKRLKSNKNRILSGIDKEEMAKGYVEMGEINKKLAE
jgi:hypothetical protein